MKINLSAKILTLSGEPIKTQTSITAFTESGEKVIIPGGTKVLTESGQKVSIDPKAEDMTLAYIFENSLLTDLEMDKDKEPRQRIERWNLAKQIHANRTGTIELETKDVAMIQERANICYPSPVICGNIDEIIEGKRKK